MKKIVLYIILLLPFNPLYGQFNTDSLENRLKVTEGADKAKTYNELFKAYVNISPATAMEYAHMAMEVAAEVNDDKGIAASLNNLGVAYKNQGVYDKALDYYLRSLRVSTAIDDQLMMASVMSNIGTVYSLKGIYDKALIYFIESHESFKKQLDKERMIGTLNNIGNAYFENGREDKALEYYEKSIALSKEINKGNAIFDPLNNMGNIYFAMESYIEALPFYQQSYEIAHATNNKYEQALSAYNLGITYFKLKRPDVAENELAVALLLANKIKSTLLLKNIYGTLSEIYYEHNRYKEAYESLILHDEYEDQLHNEESSRKIAQMEAAIAFEEKDKELEVLRKQSEIDKLIIDNNRIVIMISLMGAMMLLAVGFIIYNLKKEKSLTFYR